MDHLGVFAGLALNSQPTAQMAAMFAELSPRTSALGGVARVSARGNHRRRAGAIIATGLTRTTTAISRSRSTLHWPAFYPWSAQQAEETRVRIWKFTTRRRRRAWRRPRCCLPDELAASLIARRAGRTWPPNHADLEQSQRFAAHRGTEAMLRDKVSVAGCAVRAREIGSECGQVGRVGTRPSSTKLGRSVAAAANARGSRTRECTARPRTCAAMGNEAPCTPKS